MWGKCETIDTFENSVLLLTFSCVLFCFVCFLSELIQELMQSETLANVPEIIEKLFSETIENVKGKIGNESERVQVQRGQVLLKCAGPLNDRPVSAEASPE